jgi:hypothetical protein
VSVVRKIPKSKMKTALPDFPTLRGRRYRTKSTKSTGDNGNEIAKQELDFVIPSSFVIRHSSLPAMASVPAVREIPNQK